MHSISPKALDGIKVIDLSRVLAAPSATQILADFGAQVIKIERPSVGDETRHWNPPNFTDKDGHTTSAYFATINRGKRSPPRRNRAGAGPGPTRGSWTGGCRP